jgi:hypothetical protein
VLNGSRLDELKTIERRLRGLMEGQGALVLISGVSGTGEDIHNDGIPGTNQTIWGRVRHSPLF